jgi:metal-dependent amidase/aminoacylase/carboxypeptidase family protein
VEQVVVSVTSFETATKAHNVIPEKVKMRGTVRTLSPAIRDLAETRMKQIVEGTAATFGATAVLNYKRNYPVTVNAEDNTEFAAEAARKVSGDCDTNAPLVMGGEDFAFMLEERPGAYILVGTGEGAPVHHPKYDFNDEQPGGRRVGQADGRARCLSRAHQHHLFRHEQARQGLRAARSVA